MNWRILNVPSEGITHAERFGKLRLTLSVYGPQPI